jgi:hypothetical protein
VVAAQQAERVLEASQARLAREAELRQALQSGALTYDLHGLRPLVERPEEHYPQFSSAVGEGTRSKIFTTSGDGPARWNDSHSQITRSRRAWAFNS